MVIALAIVASIAAAPKTAPVDAAYRAEVEGWRTQRETRLMDKRDI